MISYMHMYRYVCVQWPHNRTHYYTCSYIVYQLAMHYDRAYYQLHQPFSISLLYIAGIKIPILCCSILWNISCQFRNSIFPRSSQTLLCLCLDFKVIQILIGCIFLVYVAGYCEVPQVGHIFQGGTGISVQPDIVSQGKMFSRKLATKMCPGLCTPDTLCCGQIFL